MAHSVFSKAHALYQSGCPLAFAVVLETWGAAPVPRGGTMVIASEDTFYGSVSNGCVEADVIVAALETLKSGRTNLLEFGISDETAWRSGLSCGGRIKVAVMHVSADQGLAMIESLSAARTQRRTAGLLWNFEQGKVRTVTAQDTEAATELARQLASGDSGSVVADGQELFLQVFSPAPRILIVGATHIAQHLQMLATSIGYEACIIDPRAAFTSEARFTTGTVTAWPEAVLNAATIDEATAVVTLTHIGAIDEEALAIALNSRARFIGALGSRKTHAKRAEKLRAAGISEAQIARIFAPIGLDIGAKSAGEIATAILAQIISEFRRSKRP